MMKEVFDNQEATLLEAWNLYLKLKSKQLTGIDREVSRWNKHIKHFFKDPFLLRILSNLKMLEFRVHLEEKDLSPQSVKHCLSLISRILNNAISCELYNATPPTFNFPKFDNKRIRFLSKEEIILLLSELKIQSDLWYDIARLALNTGLRAGEIFNLCTYNFNSNNKTISIVDTKTHINRVIPLNTISFEIIKERTQHRNNYVFTNSRNNKMKQVSKIFTSAIKTCRFNINIPDRRNHFVFHTLRHTFASTLVQNGVRLPIVSKLLGHTSIAMTMRYSHLSSTEENIAVELLEHYF